MATCGMYDYAGEWLLRVGLPAKSGVAGGLAAVSPGQFGVGMFSPPLDRRGNSVRAVAACRRLSEQFSLHLLHWPRLSAPEVVVPEGHRPAGGPADPVAVLGLHGDVEFAAAEIALRAAEPLRVRVAPEPAWLVFDLHRVTRLHPVAGAMLAALVGQLSERLVRVVTVDPERRRLLSGAVAEVDTLTEALARCAG